MQPLINLAPASLSLGDELFLRPSTFKIFISGKMRGGPLREERVAAAEAVESTQFAHAWYWERDANAGPYSSEGVCVGHARTSDGLILILGRTLTDITRAEFRAAHLAGAPCYIFTQSFANQDKAVRKFVKDNRDDAITAPFGNLSELRTQITGALIQFVVGAGREICSGREGVANSHPRKSDARHEWSSL